jgi:hypothetical protein
VYHAGELAGSSFSRLGVAFLRVQAPGRLALFSGSLPGRLPTQCSCLLTGRLNLKKELRLCHEAAY